MSASTVQLTSLSRAIVFLSLITAGLFGINRYAPDLLSRLVPRAKTHASEVPGKAELPALPDSTSQPDAAPAAFRALPGTEPGCRERPEVRMLLWAWNAQMGLMYANGGPQSTEGSLMCSEGVNLSLVREDDAGKMQEALVSFATALASGDDNPAKGAHFVAIMGDGSAVFLKGLNDTLDRVGPGYHARVIGSAGFSRGEDKFMGPPAWKKTPSASRGGLVAGVLRDGDWNIAQKWLGDNGLCNNPDEKTYDPSCLNWMSASDYVDAAQKYVAGACEKRPVVSGGRRTGASKHVCVDGVVTWTPGDVVVAHEKGGLVSIVSTKEYRSQMPNVVIGIDRWMQGHRAEVEGFLSAMLEGGDEVRRNPRALSHAALVSARVYRESGADAAYWERYYRGVVETDKRGLRVELGGSSVNNVSDDLHLFGLAPGSANLFAATYRVFGEIASSQYPELVASILPVSEILDTSYLRAVASRSARLAPPELPTFPAADRVSSVVSTRAWRIGFDPSRATFTADAHGELERLLRDLLVAGGTVIEVHGHTDGAGSRVANQSLSEERAFAVKRYLESQAPANFPGGRIRVFAHGQENPVAPNSTPEGRAQNRRVEIVLGTTSES